jgi:hypothetical protein
MVSAGVVIGGPPEETRAILKVSRLSVSKTGESRYDDYGYWARDYQRSIGIGIEVRGVGKPGPGRVEWFFLARETQSDVVWCYDQGTEDVWLDPAKPVSFQKTSRELKTTTSHRRGSVREAGHRPEGYVVRVIAGGQTVALVASSRNLETLARDPKRWSAVLAAGEAFREPERESGERPERLGRSEPPPREDMNPATNRRPPIAPQP